MQNILQTLKNIWQTFYAIYKIVHYILQTFYAIYNILQTIYTVYILHKKKNRYLQHLKTFYIIFYKHWKTFDKHFTLFTKFCTIFYKHFTLFTSFYKQLHCLHFTQKKYVIYNILHNFTNIKKHFTLNFLQRFKTF